MVNKIYNNIYSEDLINQALEGHKGVTVNGVHYTNIRFAGDTVVMAETEEELSGDSII